MMYNLMVFFIFANECMRTKNLTVRCKCSETRQRTFYGSFYCSSYLCLSLIAVQQCSFVQYLSMFIDVLLVNFMFRFSVS
jgi:hypothetical protein